MSTRRRRRHRRASRAPYAGTPLCKNWLKLKCSRDQEFVIVGYTAPRGGRVGLGALLLGTTSETSLSYAGKVGTGFDTATLRRLHKRLSRTDRKKPPVTLGQVNVSPAPLGPSDIGRPGTFSEWTRDGKLRHPRYSACAPTRAPARSSGRR